MNDEPKLTELVDRLTQKTRNGDILWHRGVVSGSLTTSFPRHSIKIEPGPLNERLVVTIYNGEGEMIVETPASSMISGTEKRYEVAQDKLRQLYSLAQASTEKELDELLQELR